MTDQRWRGMKAAEAFLVIERHAGSWEAAGAMMEAWVLANREPIAPGQLVELPHGFIFQPFIAPYPVSLADLMLFADMACELDGLKNLPAIAPDTRDRLAQTVNAAHDVVQRAAGTDAIIIYTSDETEACDA